MPLPASWFQPPKVADHEAAAVGVDLFQLQNATAAVHEEVVAGVEA